MHKEKYLLGAALLAYLLYKAATVKVAPLGAISKSRFLPPYNANGKTTFKAAQGRAGAYLIKNSSGAIVYVGSSSNNLYRTLYRHFQQWNHRWQTVHTYDRASHTVRIIYGTPLQAERLEIALLKRYQPPDNIQKLESFSNAATEKAYQTYRKTPTEAPDVF